MVSDGSMSVAGVATESRGVGERLIAVIRGEPSDLRSLTQVILYVRGSRSICGLVLSPAVEAMCGVSDRSLRAAQRTINAKPRVH